MTKSRRLTPDNSLWVMAGNAGDTGGPSPVNPVGTIQMLPSGDQSGSQLPSRRPIQIMPMSTRSFSMGLRPGVNEFHPDNHLEDPGTVNLLRVQALEFEMQLVLNGGIYNMAHQWLLAPEGRH